MSPTPLSRKCACELNACCECEYSTPLRTHANAHKPKLLYCRGQRMIAIYLSCACNLNAINKNSAICLIEITVNKCTAFVNLNLASLNLRHRIPMLSLIHKRLRQRHNSFPMHFALMWHGHNKRDASATQITISGIPSLRLP